MDLEEDPLDKIGFDFNKKTLFYYDDIIGTYNYSMGHPMKPFRVSMTNELVKNYGLYPKLNIYDNDFVESFFQQGFDHILTKFHSDDYIELIKQIKPENKIQYEDQLYTYNFGEDCPVMDRLYEYCCVYSSASVVAAKMLAEKNLDVAINWSGGFHHAKQSEASGFCYVNDVVLAILELLKHYQRVLYIDIDIHHGDGVEEAFYLTDRVMTCSFHKYKDFFPGTGSIDDIGIDKGKYHAVNFPLNQGLNDDSFVNICKPVLKSIMENFQPEAVVIQCGADSLSGDRLGCFNLSIKGHGECVKYIKSFGVPYMLVGGGGYTLRNVPRCWTYETSIAIDEELPNEIPQNEYFEYFAPEYKLHLPISNMENLNSKEYLDQTTIKILDNLKQVIKTGVQITNLNDTKDDFRHDLQEAISATNDKKQEEALKSQ